MFFSELKPKDAAALTMNRVGVLLRDGDFMEGAFQGLSQDRVTVSSVLFGLRSYSAKTEVAAILLRPVVANETKFTLRLADGSRHRAERLSTNEEGLLLSGPLFQQLLITKQEAFVLRRSPSPTVLQFYREYWSSVDDRHRAASEQGRQTREEIATTADTKLRTLLEALANSQDALADQSLVVAEQRERWLDLLKATSAKGHEVLAKEKERAAANRLAYPLENEFRREQRTLTSLERQITALEKAKSPNPAKLDGLREAHAQLVKTVRALEEKSQSARAKVTRLAQEHATLRKDHEELLYIRDRAGELHKHERETFQELESEWRRCRDNVRARKETLTTTRQ